MPKQVMLYDGTPLEFPDDTPQVVIDNVARRETESRRKASTDSMWRPVAQGIGAAIGGAGGLPLGPAGAYGGMALGDAMGGQVYDLAADAFRGDFSANANNQALRALQDVGWAGAVAPVGDAAIPFVKSLVGKAVRPLTPTGRLAGKLRGGQDISRLTEDLEAAGIQPTADLLTNNPEMQALGQSLRGMPGSGKILRESDIATTEAAKAYAGGVASSMGTPRTPAEVGGILRQYAQRTKHGMKMEFDRLYDDIEAALPDDELIPLHNTRAFFDGYEELAKTPLGREAMKGILPVRDQFYATITKEYADPSTGEVKKIIDPRITAGNARALKSIWGDVFKKNAEGIPERMGKELYHAMKRDILDAAISTSQETAQALKETDSMYSAFKGNPKTGVTGHQDVLDGMIQRDAGDAYKWLTQGVLDPASSGGRVGHAFGMLPENVSGDIRATITDQLGRATPGVQNAEGDAFSFSRFLTNFNRMSPETRAIVFGDKLPEIERLARISEAVKGTEKFANTSNTSNLQQWRNFISQPVTAASGLMGIGGAALSPATLVAGAAPVAGQFLVNRQMAKMMTNPETALWLARGAPQVQKQVSPGLMGLLGINMEDQARSQ